jgi:hypothetical protein
LRLSALVGMIAPRGLPAAPKGAADGLRTFPGLRPLARAARAILAAMSTAKRAVAVRMGERRAARVERRGVDLFNAEAFGPPEGEPQHVERVRPRREGELRRIVGWVRREHWSAQIVLALMAVAVAYLALVAGLLVGAGVAPWLAG